MRVRDAAMHLDWHGTRLLGWVWAKTLYEVAKLRADTLCLSPLQGCEKGWVRRRRLGVRRELAKERRMGSRLLVWHERVLLRTKHRDRRFMGFGHGKHGH